MNKDFSQLVIHGYKVKDYFLGPIIFTLLQNHPQQFKVVHFLKYTTAKKQSYFKK